MSEDDLKSFKISDAKPRPQDRGRSEEAPAEAASVGFPAIEAQVEADAPALPGMLERMGQLSDIAGGGGSAKDKGAAKKAAQGYEKAAAVLQHLLETKHQMAGGAADAESSEDPS